MAKPMTHVLIDQKVPAAVFKTRVRDESAGGENPYRWQDLASDEIFKNKKIVLFALPGAFTPVCSEKHAPGFEKKYDEFKKLGVDQVICLAVNDAFVMKQWADKTGLKKVFMLPDGNGEFTRKMGMLVKKENVGYGMRSWRYSMFADNGIIRALFVEPGFADNAEKDPFEVSDCDTMLEYLKKPKHKVITS